MNLTCLIIDDDLMCRKSLERLVKKTDTLDLIKVCENAEEAIEFLEKNTVDLLFLDVEMPGISGIELLDKIPIAPHIIFTTSKTEYAHEAFEYQAIDYLKKPITQPRFQIAISKTLEKVQQIPSIRQDANEIYIKEDKKLIRLAFEDILFFENVGDYVRVKTQTSNHIIYGTMKGIDDRLTDRRFLKVHRSFIVNMDKIKDIEDNTLVIEKTVIPISRAHKSLLMNRLNLL